jgi:hypothetical protein
MADFSGWLFLFNPVPSYVCSVVQENGKVIEIVEKPQLAFGYLSRCARETEER